MSYVFGEVIVMKQTCGKPSKAEENDTQKKKKQFSSEKF
jgi:hypothetical protein